MVEMEFKEQLFTVRKRLGLSQKEMAETLGVSRWAIIRLEKGEIEPNYKTLMAFEALKPKEQPRLIDDRFLEGITVTPNVNNDVSRLIESAQMLQICNINFALLQRNYYLGKRIAEEILTTRAKDYGQEILQNLSKFLTEKYGNGFDISNLSLFIRFYRCFPNILDARQKSFLSWTHYRSLLSVDDKEARVYREREALFLLEHKRKRQG